MAIPPILPVPLAALVAGGGAVLLLPASPGRARRDGLLRRHDRPRPRAALRALDARLLRDIGSRRAKAEREAGRHD